MCRHISSLSVSLSSLMAIKMGNACSQTVKTFSNYAIDIATNRIRQLQFAASCCAIRRSPFAIWHSQLNFEWQSNRVQFVEYVPYRGGLGERGVGGARQETIAYLQVYECVCACVLNKSANK